MQKAMQTSTRNVNFDLNIVFVNYRNTVYTNKTSLNDPRIMICLELSLYRKTCSEDYIKGRKENKIKL